MKKLILYKSNCGSTKKYAEDIGKAVGADVMPLKQFKWKALNQYDIIVFGGWVMGGNIQGVNDFLVHWEEMKDRNVIIFAVGMGYPTPEGRNTLINQTVLDLYHIRFYQFQGSFDFKKLNLVHKALMKTSIARIARKPDATEGDKQLLSVLENPLEVYDQAKVDRVIEVIEKIEAEDNKA